MGRVVKWLRIILIASILFVNITGFSSAAFFNWMTAGDDSTKDVKVDDGPIYWDEWQGDFLEFISCGRIDNY